MRLQGKVAVVTGAASGIGRATVQLFAREGARVVLADVDEGGLAETARLVAEQGGEPLVVPCDVAVEEDVRLLMERTVAQHGRLDVLFNNAGIGNPLVPLGEMPFAEFQRTLSVNLHGVFLGCKYGAPVMAEQGGGSIINTASVEAFFGGRFLGPYNASKGGVMALTKSVAADYGDANVRVNCICPGLIDTPLVKGAREMGLWEVLEQKHLLRRAGRPEEVAATVLFLASEESSFITGSALFVDGGLTASVGV